MSVIYRHTNLVARDWRALARFYESVFGCERLLPERDLNGEWLERGTGVAGAALSGIHLRLPGSEATLEIFEYAEGLPKPPAVANREGFGHLAFEVDDVGSMLERVLRHEGGAAGEPVTREIQGVGRLTFVYVRDPEGNLIELQSCERSALS